MKFNKNKYDNNYKKQHYIRVTTLISKQEKDIIKKLNSVDSKSNYLKQLILKDIKKQIKNR